MSEEKSTNGPSILGLVAVGIGIALALVSLFLPKLEVDTHLQSTGINYGDLGTVAPLTVNSMLQTGSGALIILCSLLASVGFWRHYGSGRRTWAPLPAGAGLVAIAIYQSTGDRVYVTANLDSYWRFAKGSPSLGIYVAAAAGALLLLGGILCAQLLPETVRKLGRSSRVQGLDEGPLAP
jgi:hypothetical protein